jgi:TorA maturation chaperone TorD
MAGEHTMGASVDAAELSLAPLARWFGAVLLRELTADDLEAMAAPEVASALAAVGVSVPAVADLPELGARWFDLFLQPKHCPPPVQSLWEEGHYDGAAMVAARTLATAAGLEPGDGARSAPPDHLGCLLCLWAELAEVAPDLLPQLANGHFGFVDAALATARRDTGFYGEVARAVTGFVAELAGKR